MNSTTSTRFAAPYKGIAVTRGRFESNIFHILESTTGIITLALHPELFPPVHTIIASSCNFGRSRNWWETLKSLILDLFAPSRRPIIIDTPEGINRDVCDDTIVVMNQRVESVDFSSTWEWRCW